LEEGVTITGTTNYKTACEEGYKNLWISKFVFYPNSKFFLSNFIISLNWSLWEFHKLVYYPIPLFGNWLEGYL